MRREAYASIIAAALVTGGCHPAMTAGPGLRGAGSQPNVNIHVVSVPEDRVSMVLYVDQANPLASDSNPGTEQQPFGTISAGMRAAQTNNIRHIGTKVLVRPGVYREQVLMPLRSGASDSPVILEAAEKGSVIISGSDIWTGWQRQGATDIYTHAWPYRWGLAPYPAGWEGSVDLQPIVRRREMVFVNDKPVQQVLAESDLVPNSFYIAEAAATIFLRLDSHIAIEQAKVEVAVRSPLFRAQGQTNLVLRGLTFQYANSAVPDPAVEILDSSQILIENCNFAWNNWDGFNVTTSSDVTIRGVTADHNGSSGFGGYKLKRILVQDSETSYNNWRGAAGGFYGWAPAGSKFGAIHDAVLLRYRSISNQARGLWFDSDDTNITIQNSELGRNFSDGIFIEANQGPFAIRDSFLHDNLNAVLGANSSDVTLIGNYLWNNSEAQIKITGVLSRDVSNWETNEQFSLRAERWTVGGNLIQSQSGQLWLKTPNWQPFLGSINSDSNYWTRSTDLRGFLIGPSTWAFPDWQRSLGADAKSVALAW